MTAGNSLKALASETLVLNCKYKCIIEDAVKRTQERVIPTGILLPQSLIVRLAEGEFFTLVFLFHSSIKC